MGQASGMLTLDGLVSDRFETVAVVTPDLAGRLVGKRLPLRQFLESGRDGLRACDVVFGWGIGHELLDGFSSIGWDRGYGDVVLQPDLTTLRPLGWWPKTAVVVADAVRDDGAAFPLAPREILRRQIKAAADLNLTALVASELEFTVFDETAASLRAKGYAALQLHRSELHPELLETVNLDEPFVAEIVRSMEASGVPIEAAKAEYSPSQFEINLAPSAPVEAADRHALYKLGVREIARSHGLAASFLAKWHEDFGGSSCHMHISLANDQGNIFGEGSDDAIRWFIGGLQHHAKDVFLLWAPYPNSYKRFRPGTFAPASINWGVDNRTATFRVAGSGKNRHVENRIPGADVNPYLAFAALLASGLAGIRDRIEPGEGVGHQNAYSTSGLPSMPATADEAVSDFVSSPFAREAFGDAVVDDIANFSAQEVAASRRAVTDWDRRRLFDI